MNYSHGVLHDNGHPRGATVPLPKVTAALLPVHPVVTRVTVDRSHLQASASQISGSSPLIDRTVTGCLP